MFEKILTGGSSNVNTRLSFDTELLMLNSIPTEYDKMKIDGTFRAYKRDDLKPIYKIKFDNENTYHERRVIAKVLKLDKNNQHGYAMIKLMPMGCIKEYPSPSMLKFNLLLESVDLDDKIRRLLVVDIKLDQKNATEQEVLYDEIMPLIIEKQKILEANERSVYQLLDLIKKTSKAVPKSYRCTQKSYNNMFPKTFIPVYQEDLKFLITRCCWKVTNICTDYIFKEACLKQDFVTMNQNYRQKGKNSIEKDFYKLMNNANFGFDYRNSVNNVKFVPITDEINEISYIKKYHNLFDQKFRVS